MCGIAGLLSLDSKKIPDLRRALGVMNRLQRHRGPDGKGVWEHPRGMWASQIAVERHRFSRDSNPCGTVGNWITYNGEINNYIELRAELGPTCSRRIPIPR